MKLRLQDVKEPIARVLQMVPDDERVAAYLNEATQRLLTKGKWWGTYARIQLASTGRVITWPRWVAALEQVAVCCGPVEIRNQWFELIQDGIGVTNDGDTDPTCWLGLLDRGTACVFSDLVPGAKKIKVYSDLTETGQILIQGTDDSGNRVMTQDGLGNWIDGELITLATTGTLSTKVFASVDGVQKPVTQGPVRIFEYDTVATTQRAIGVYDPDETVPQYRRSLIPSLRTTSTTTLTAMAKKEFRQVTKDTDYLLIGNLGALKEMVRAIQKLEANLPEEAIAYEKIALRELDTELAHYLGDGERVTARIEDATPYHTQPIENLM